MIFKQVIFKQVIFKQVKTGSVCSEVGGLSIHVHVRALIEVLSLSFNLIFSLEIK